MRYSPNRLGSILMPAFAALLLSACGGDDSDSNSIPTGISSSLAGSLSPSSSSENSSLNSGPPNTSSSLSSVMSQPTASSQSSSSSVPAQAGDASILFSAGTFEQGPGLFDVYVEAGNGAVATFNGEVDITIPAVGAEPWHVQFRHDMALQAGQTYSICFDAKAASVRDITVNADSNEPLYESVMGGGSVVTLTSNYETYKTTFVATATDSTARMTISLADEAISVQFDNVGVYVGDECGNPDPQQGPEGAGSANVNGIVPITTEGNQVLFGGQRGSIAGMSLFWSNDGWGGERFYNADVVRELKEEWGAKLIRPAMGVEEVGGYLDNRSGNRAKLETVVNAAIDHDMYVIVDWHTHNAEEHKADAIEFFKAMANQYGDKDNVIYEIYNEPDDKPYYSEWSADIKPYALDVIKEIRAIDPDNLIIVGTPFYSAEVDDVIGDPITEYDNIAYTLHFYAATHKGANRAKAVQAINAGLPLFATEWGMVGASGDGGIDIEETDAWMKLLYDNNISHANWALNDKNEGSSALRPGVSATGGWSDSDLTDSGRYVKEIILGW